MTRAPWPARAGSLALTAWLAGVGCRAGTAASSTPEPGRGAEPAELPIHDGASISSKEAASSDEAASDEAADGEWLDHLLAPPPLATMPGPLPFEVIVYGMIVEGEDARPDEVLLMQQDYRMIFHLKILRIEPATPLLEPGIYTLFIDDPNEVFGGKPPAPNHTVRLRLTVIPDPTDPSNAWFTDPRVK